MRASKCRDAYRRFGRLKPIEVAGCTIVSIHRGDGMIRAFARPHFSTALLPIRFSSFSLSLPLQLLARSQDLPLSFSLGSRSPRSALRPFYQLFFGKGSPTKIDYRKKAGTLILTSLLELDNYQLSRAMYNLKLQFVGETVGQASGFCKPISGLVGNPHLRKYLFAPLPTSAKCWGCKVWFGQRRSERRHLPPHRSGRVSFLARTWPSGTASTTCCAAGRSIRSWRPGGGIGFVFLAVATIFVGLFLWRSQRVFFFLRLQKGWTVCLV